MRYFLIVGEASGDLHASHLMKALRQCDPDAEFYFYGGDLMSEAGGIRMEHYKTMAYMGFIPVLLHLPTIMHNLSACKQAIQRLHPDVVILVDYPGFNLKIARFVRQHVGIPVFYYISPKIWAWKEHRIKNIRRDVDALFSILPAIFWLSSGSAKILRTSLLLSAIPSAARMVLDAVPLA